MRTAEGRILAGLEPLFKAVGQHEAIDAAISALSGVSEELEFLEGQQLVYYSSFYLPNNYKLERIIRSQYYYDPDKPSPHCEVSIYHKNFCTNMPLVPGQEVNFSLDGPFHLKCSTAMYVQPDRMQYIWSPEAQDTVLVVVSKI